jgi:outer membrane lipoprotein-sorting protein
MNNVGTPTVQELLDKVKQNYHKIKDLKADTVAKATTTDEDALWIINKIFGGLLKVKAKFYFKAPDKIKRVPEDEYLKTIMIGQIEYRRSGAFGEPVTETTPVRTFKLPWYTLLEPWNLIFYWRLDELITKFDTKVISNPESNIWVIEAVPKASNPEDIYNYPLPGGVIKFFIDYEKGVIIKFDDYGPLHDGITNKAHTLAEIQNFKLLGKIWIPTKFIKTIFSEKGNMETKEEITFNNVQLNTDIPDSEFEF